MDRSEQTDRFSERLREERKRLGLSQAVLAQLGGVRARAQGNYENGERSPDAEYLSRIARAGVDVHYVITGQRVASGGALREEVDMELLHTCMLLVDEEALKRGLGYLDRGWFARVTAAVYKRTASRLGAEGGKDLEIAEREAANVVDLMAEPKGRSELRTGSKAIDELIGEIIRLRVRHVRSFLDQTRDSAYGELIKRDLGEQSKWAGRERGKLLRELLAGRLIEFEAKAGGKLRVVNEGRCAAWLSSEIDQLKRDLYTAGRDSAGRLRRRAAGGAR